MTTKPAWCHYLCLVFRSSQSSFPGTLCSAWRCTGWASVPVRSPWLHQTWTQPVLELPLLTQLEQDGQSASSYAERTHQVHIFFYTEYRELQPTQSKHCSVNLERITEKFSYICLHIPEKMVCRPEAVAGLTPFRELSSAMAVCTSGRRVKAFLEHFSTSSSLLEATSCCSLGLNFPLCRQAHRATQGHIWWRECFKTLHAISKLYYVFEGVITGACGWNVWNRCTCKGGKCWGNIQKYSDFYTHSLWA